MFTNDPIRIWSRCVRKWFLFPIHAGLLTIIRKRLKGKKFTSSIHFNHYFWLTGSFRNTRLKWQFLPLVWVVQRQNAFSFRGVALWPPDQGLCPWTPLGLCPQTVVIGSRSALTMSSTRAFCPAHWRIYHWATWAMSLPPPWAVDRKCGKLKFSPTAAIAARVANRGGK